MLTFRTDIATFFDEQCGNSTRLDVLTGFIGDGAARMIQRLGTKTRLVFGLSSSNPRLTHGQLAELRRLLELCEVRTLDGLHEKSYLFDQVFAVGSSNFTSNGFHRLREALLITDERRVLAAGRTHFEQLWALARPANPTKIIAIEGGEGEPSQLGVAQPPVKKPSSTLKSSKLARNGVVRLCSFDPKWITTLDESDSIVWSTSPRAKPGDLQLFAISKPAPKVRIRSNSVDAAHSIWIARSTPRPHAKWGMQSDFDLLVRLENPVPKADFFAAGLLKVPRWPQGSQGKHLSRDRSLLAATLVRRNPRQATRIREILRQAT